MNRLRPLALGALLAAVMATAPQLKAAGIMHAIVQSSTSLEELLLKKGFSASQASSLMASRAEVLRSLGGEGEILSGGVLYQRMAALKVEGNRDSQIQKQMLKLLASDDSKLSQKQMGSLFNQMIYLSNRYGSSAGAVLVCSQCVDTELARSGIHFALGAIVEPSNKKVLSLVPNRPSDLKRYLARELKGAGLGDYSKVSSKFVKPEEERSLALFLAMRNSSDQASRDLYTQIIKLSTDKKSGKANLFNSVDTHKLWKIFSDDPNSAEKKSWVSLLKEVESNRAEGESLESAFYGVLEKRASKDESLADELEVLKEKNCYFR